jgi:hypothetical protein
MGTRDRIDMDNGYLQFSRMLSDPPPLGWETIFTLVIQRHMFTLSYLFLSPIPLHADRYVLVQNGEQCSLQANALVALADQCGVGAATSGANSGSGFKCFNGPGTVRFFFGNFTLEDAIGSHAFFSGVHCLLPGLTLAIASKH